jgi:hypothetical protein
MVMQSESDPALHPLYELAMGNRHDPSWVCGCERFKSQLQL